MHTNMVEAQQREATLKQQADRAKQRLENVERYQSQQVQEADRAAAGAKRAKANLEEALRKRITAIEEYNKSLK